MRFALLSRDAGRDPRRAAASAAPRVTTIAGRLREWFDARRHDDDGPTLPGNDFAPLDLRPAPRSDKLRRAQRHFARELADVPAVQSGFALAAIWRAASLHDLWHLRAQVFDIVARHHDQRQADERLARLDAHFPARPTRSRPLPLDPLR